MGRSTEAFVLGLGLAVIGAPWVRADEARASFDGAWDTQLSCDSAGGALGYMFEFPSRVLDGQLEGGKGERNQPGWFQVEGRIQEDGSAYLVANGMVGASQVAIGHRPVGSEYAYQIKAVFSQTRGAGDRVEGRPCHVIFQRR